MVTLMFGALLLTHHPMGVLMFGALLLTRHPMGVGARDQRPSRVGSKLTSIYDDVASYIKGMTTRSFRPLLEGKPNAAAQYRGFVSSGLSNFRLVVQQIDLKQYKYICCKGTCPNPPSTAYEYEILLTHGLKLCKSYSS